MYYFLDELERCVLSVFLYSILLPSTEINHLLDMQKDSLCSLAYFDDLFDIGAFLIMLFCLIWFYVPDVCNLCLAFLFLRIVSLICLDP